MDHAKKVYGDWLKEPNLALVTGDLLSELGDKQPFDNLLNILTKEIENRFDIGGDEK